MPASFSVINTVTQTANQIAITAGLNPVFTIWPNPVFPGTAGATLPSGTTAQRGGPAGTMRYNTTTGLIEFTNDGITWATSPSVTIPTTDEAVARFDGVAGALQNSLVLITDAGVMSGATQLNVDNLRLDGNTLSITNVNGDLNLSPNGTGVTNLVATATASSELRFFELTGGGVNYVSLKAPNALAGNVNFILPTIAPTVNGQALVSTIAGQWSFATVPTVTTPTTDEALARFDGVGGALQNSIAILTDAGALSGLTQLDVDNLRLDLNTISSTNVGGDILLLCNTTGAVEISSNATKAGTLRFREPVGGGTNFITFQAPAMAGDTSYTWWPAYPTLNGQLATCTTAGVMTWTTATFPAAAGAAGTILRSDGTNWLASTSTFADTYAASTLLYSNGANTVAGLATAANGLLVTSNTSVPSILAGPGTTGNMLQSNAAAAPSFSTATYPSTTTINRILYSSANNTVSEIVTAANGVLVTSAGGVPSISSVLPAAVSIASNLVVAVRTQVFTTTGAGTYTPSTGMIACLAIAVGAGGGGGGCSATNLGVAGGGGGGGTSIAVFSAATIGASKALSVGAGGAGGAAGNNPGTAGGNTTFGPAGSLLVANGGSGGAGSNGGAAVAGVMSSGGAGGTATTGTVNFAGENGGLGVNFGVAAGSQFLSGQGGGSFFGPGAASKNGDGAGNAAVVYGGGGSGAIDTSTTASAGGNGSNGIIYIIEFCNQ